MTLQSQIKKISLTNNLILSFFEIKKYIFCPFQDFQGPRSKFKNFPGHGKFFPNSRIFLNFQGPRPKFKDVLGPGTFSPNSRSFQDFQGPWQS